MFTATNSNSSADFLIQPDSMSSNDLDKVANDGITHVFSKLISTSLSCLYILMFLIY